MLCRCLLLFLFFISLSVGIYIWMLSSSVVPKLDETWWGPRERENDTSIRPFRIKFDNNIITDLKRRLTHHRPWTPPLEGISSEYGFNTDILNDWLNYWAEEYPFKEQEDFLNKYPQFKTNIQGLDIHFIWVKPQAPKDVEVIPIMLIQGWPGYVREFYETILELTKFDPKRNFVLEVIVPSLPGFGFSDAAVRPGLGATEMAVVLNNLMQRLGFTKYYVHGVDWGAFVAGIICGLYPEKVIGHHSTMPVSLTPLTMILYVAGSFYPSLIVEEALQGNIYPILSHWYWYIRETGYLYMQATKPDTLGVAMSDSPAGQLAYILQVIASGTNKDSYFQKDGGLDVYQKNALLDILTLNWIANSFTTSARIYAESVNLNNWFIYRIPTPVPTCTLHVKNELIYQPHFLLKHKYTNLLNSTVFDHGGHFYGLEQPKILADNVLRCVETVREWRRSENNKDEL